MISVKALREKQGLSQEELASKIGLTRSAVAMIENGSNKLTVDNAKKIGEVLRVDWKEFFID
jgi:transcriptional regulator with XRE-family HTH domain